MLRLLCLLQLISLWIINISHCIRVTWEKSEYVVRVENLHSPTIKNDSDRRPEIWIMGLFPLSGSWAGGEGMFPAIEIGLNHINANPDVLPDYQLKMLWADTKCDIGRGTNQMYQMLYAAPVKHVILGTGCSFICEVTGQCSYHWNLTQISYSCVSPALSDKTVFPKFLRTASPDVTMNPARIAFFNHHNWTKIATLHQSLNIFSAVTEDLVKKLNDNNMSLVLSDVFIDDPATQVFNLYKRDARIIMGGFYEDKAVKVFCECYKLGFYGPKYLWFLVGWYSEEWWEKAEEHTNCTVEQVKLALEGHIASGIIYLNPEPVRGVSGLLPEEFLMEYQTLTEKQRLFAGFKAGQAYDTVWTIALALNKTINDLAISVDKKNILDFRYDDKEMTELIFRNMKNVKFQGMKGFIEFNKNGDHIGMIKFDRMQDGKMVTVGFYRPTKEDSNNIVWNKPLVWKTTDGEAPHDAVTVITEQIRISISVYVVISSISVIGIIVALAALSTNFLYKHERIIKMSSPAINNIIFIGCIVVYSTVLFQNLNNTYTAYFCKLRTFTLITGYSLAFGALFAKTWRVHAIFTRKIRKTIISDSHLLCIVGGLVSLDIAIFTVWEVYDPQRAFVRRMTENHVVKDDIIHQYEVQECHSTYQTYFVGTLYCIKGLLLIFGVFLAWETRKVTIPALNDSKNIGMCIYNVVMLSVLGVTLNVVLDQRVLLKYALTSAILILATSATQLIVFVPKVLKLYESRRTGVDGTKSDFAAGTSGSNTTESLATIDIATNDLKNEIALLNAAIAQKDKLIGELKGQLTEART